MCAEIDRLGLDRGRFQWIVDEEGLDFGKSCLSQRTKESKLFDKWFPRLTEFARSIRSQSPFPSSDGLGLLDAATLRILEPKVADAEHVPCLGNFTAAFFTAPLHVLPFVTTSWPSTYRNPVFLTPDELKEWQQIYDADEKDQESWWFVFQHWDTEINPAADSFWLRDRPVQPAKGRTLALISCGLYWGSLAGGSVAELWEIDADGTEAFLEIVGDITC
jgi:hypothetical protein